MPFPHPHDEFERSSEGRRIAGLPAKRGINDKRVSYWEKPSLIVDTLDVGLFGLATPSCPQRVPAHTYHDNEDLWLDLLGGNIGHGDTVRLEDFQILEWLPSAPGRYFTPQATSARERAEAYYSGNEYLPLGKEEMVFGGVGCVRLAPRVIRGGEVCFLCASSNGVSHEGIPLLVPLGEAAALAREVRANGRCGATVTATIWPLPLEQSPLQFDRGIPKYYLFAETWTQSERFNAPLVTVAITYNSNYEGEAVQVGDIRINSSKNWSFASFNPSHTDGLGDAVEWMQGYARRHARGEVSILGDFDEIYQHFENAIEFPLSSILAGRYDPQRLGFYAQTLQIKINEVVMGDKFQNVQNSTIVNRSRVEHALNSVRQASGEEVASVFAEVAKFVEQSNNKAAGSLLNTFTEELSKPVPSKSALRHCWDGLVNVLPDVAKIAGAGVKLAGLLS